MYLFQRLLIRELPDRLMIYIPLCIYFNSFRHWLRWFRQYLHSTMYLFQPMPNQYSLPLRTTFTFHYVSISTSVQSFIHRFSLIYIPLCIYFNTEKGNDIESQKDLHSTMYLFQRWCLEPFTAWAYNLHSTMYLFQLIITAPSFYNLLFTFHYVSISTKAYQYYW